MSRWVGAAWKTFHARSLGGNVETRDKRFQFSTIIDLQKTNISYPPQVYYQALFMPGIQP